MNDDATQDLRFHEFVVTLKTSANWRQSGLLGKYSGICTKTGKNMMRCKQDNRSGRDSGVKTCYGDFQEYGTWALTHIWDTHYPLFLLDKTRTQALGADAIVSHNFWR
ncbi:hypothetical protein ACFX1R_003046 [Malus domestica]